jgi:hypothetical protein
VHRDSITSMVAAPCARRQGDVEQVEQLELETWARPMG